MYRDTAGKIYYELIDECDCGLTGGCEKCKPYFNEIHKPTIEEVRKITDKLPSLTKILLEERY